MQWPGHTGSRVPSASKNHQCATTYNLLVALCVLVWTHTCAHVASVSKGSRSEEGTLLCGAVDHRTGILVIMTDVEGSSALGATAKRYPRPGSRYGIGMHGWMRRQADRFDMLRSIRGQPAMEASRAAGSGSSQDPAPPFTRVGPMTRAPGFNPSRWTTFICGRPVVVRTIPHIKTLSIACVSTCGRAFRLSQ